MKTLYLALVDNKIVRDDVLWKGYRKSSNIEKNFPELYNLIYKHTKFLPENAKIGERIYCIKHNISKRVTCLTCGTPVKYKDARYHEYCSLKCSNSSEHVKKKKEESSLMKFGTKYASQSKEIQKKQRITFHKKYGVYYPFQSKEIQTKMKNNWMEKYGVDNPRKSLLIKRKIKNTNLKRYGVIRYAQHSYSEDTLNLLNDRNWLYENHVVLKKPLTEIANELHVSDVTIGNYLRKHKIKTRNFQVSTIEKEVQEFLKNLEVDIIINTRNIISPHELDIYIPSHNLAIEICGLFWHSEYMGKDRNYHFNKMKKCNEKGIRLLTIFEDEWRDKKNIVKSTIKHILGKSNIRIYARNTKIVYVKTKEKNSFFDSFHIQGACKSSISYGLLYDNNLVACMSFTKSKENNYVLSRYASSCLVTGGFSKLLVHFIKNHNFNEIISFADLRWSKGELYEKNGWKLDKILRPDYSYVKGTKRYHKFNFRHKNLRKILNNYDPNLSESENCKNNYIYKIWNCGLKRYIISFNQ